MNFDDATKAIDYARSTVSQGDRVLRELARLLAGRLRVANVPTWVLKELKAELQDFNRHTGTWRTKE
jgi:hypothetical protein